MAALPHGPDGTANLTDRIPRQRRSVVQIAAEFASSVAEAMGRGGQEEDQLRGPFQELLRSMGAVLGIPVAVYGEVRLPHLQARPDFGVDAVGVTSGPNNRIGYVELKKPSKPIPPSDFLDKHDRDQWQKFQSLPNILYTNGTQWALFRYGEQQGPTAEIPAFSGRRRTAPSAIADFELLIWDFLSWEPSPDYTLGQLITRTAGLCERLRAEVAEIIAEEETSPGPKPFTRLAEEWRELMFPQLAPGLEFADAYAQTITFSLLLARESGVQFSGRSVREIGELLGKRHPLLGEALGILTDARAIQRLTVLPTLIRILEPIDWQELMRGEQSAYVDLYETFLSRYDPELRKKSGSYYTPEPVTRYMVDFVDDILKARMERFRGLADESVTTVDPAMGTGTFLASVMRSVARTLTEAFGEVHARTHLKELYRERLVGFERSAAPFAVAELRLHQQLQEQYRTEVPDRHRRFLVNTLDDPSYAQQRFGLRYEEIVQFRDEANRIKKTAPVMVVVGNPPYIRHAKQRDPAPWIEARRLDPSTDPVETRPSMDEFREPGNGRREYKLSAVGSYFWRWATWKVFDAHPEQPSGIVAFVSTSAYLTQEAFAGMRRYLRETADEGWVIELSPEGHQPPVASRIFGGVQQPVCIGVFARYGKPRPHKPATVWHTRLEGDRVAKFNALENDSDLRLDGARWTECAAGWTAPFIPEEAAWQSHPAVGDLLPWQQAGVNTSRTWVYAPDRETLLRRWNRLTSAAPEDKDRLFKATWDRTATEPFRGMRPVGEETACPQLTRAAYRAFDRQNLIGDVRFVDRPRPPLWHVRGDRQIYVVEQHTNTVTSGPGLIFSSLVPDMHYFQGHHGGRVLPLYRDPEGSSPNLAHGLLPTLSAALGLDVCPDDLAAYIAAVVAHPGYTRTFRKHLAVPGIRVPLTRDSAVWTDAVALGREVIWLHTYGERFTDVPNGRPAGPPRLPPGNRPEVVAEIPDSPTAMPDAIRHDSDNGASGQRLYVGDGVISPVLAEVWRYDVGGMRIIKKWFSSRQRNPRDKRRGSPLDDIGPERWTPRFTDELLELLTVLTRLVELEPRQTDLLGRVLSGPLISAQNLTTAGVLPVAPGLRKPPKSGQAELPLD